MEVIYKGNQALEDMHALVNSILPLIDKMPDRQVDYLIDLTKAGHVKPAAGRFVLSVLPKLKIKRQAVFGGSVFIRHLINFMMMATNKDERIRYFNTRTEAEAWLEKEA